MKNQINRSQSMLQLSNSYSQNQPRTEVAKFKQPLPEYPHNTGIRNHFVSLDGETNIEPSETITGGLP